MCKPCGARNLHFVEIRQGPYKLAVTQHSEHKARWQKFWPDFIDLYLTYYEAIKPKILSAVQLAGNSLNFNPDVHAIASRYLLNPKTRELKEVNFMPYQTMRSDWQRAICHYLRRRRLICKDEYDFFLKKCLRGFHVHFQRITGKSDDVIFKTAQYIALGLFHNSQIENVNREKKNDIPLQEPPRFPDARKNF